MPDIKYTDPQTEIDKYYKDFLTWLKKNYGKDAARSQQMINKYWTYWYSNVRTGGRQVDPTNMNFIVDVEDSMGADGKVIPYGYETRVTDFLNSLIYDNAISFEEASGIAQQIEKAIKMYKDGDLTLEQLPFINELSQRDYDKWSRWYSNQAKSEKKAFQDNLAQEERKRQQAEDEVAEIRERMKREEGMVRAHMATAEQEAQSTPIIIPANNYEYLDELLANQQGGTLNSFLGYPDNRQVIIDTSFLADELVKQEEISAMAAQAEEEKQTANLLGARARNNNVYTIW